MCTDDATFSAEEQASFNVDALVNDTEPEIEPTRSVPSTPMSGHFFAQTRRATPTIPPGFSAPAIPRTVVAEAKSRPGSRPMSRTTSSTITPAVPVVPVVPVTPIRAATPSKAKKAKQTSDMTPTASTPAKPPPQTPTRTTTKASTVKTPTVGGAANKGTDENVSQKKHQPKAEEKKLSTETTSKEPVKAKSNKNLNLTEGSPQRKAMRDIKTDKAEPKDTTPVPVVTPVSSAKRHPPGKLDIKAAMQGSAIEQSPGANSHKIDAQTKTVRATPVTSTPSVPASPANMATGSPIKRAVAPRTLRVVPTPKTEIPPPLSATSTPSMPQGSTVNKLRSRQASVASVNLPGTPISEMMSDTASITSTSISRASSPPPIGGKVGTAPVRQKTKSQAKKDRQERKKQLDEELAGEDPKSDVEVVQAPIIGRKKKTKKSTPILKPVVAATKSQPASPRPITIEEDHSDIPAAVTKPDQSAKTSAAATPDPEQIPESRDRREHTAQSILADLQKTGELLASTLEFFKPLSSSLTHASRNTPANTVTGPPDLKIHFSEADLEAIAKKKPVRLNGHDGRPDSRTLITPNGKFFWGLSEELEEKALQLEKQIEELRGHARFHPRKHTSHSHIHSAAQSQSKDVLPAIATALKEAGKKLGNNNTQQMPKLDAQTILNETGRETQQPPPPPQPQTPADAGAYLNQFVLPKSDNPPPNQPRPEMAAVGGAPGAGTANISVNAGKFAKAAKAVVEGGAVGSTEIDGMGMMAADLLGGVFVQGLEALVGAGLGFESSQEFGLDANGNITLGRGGGGLDVQGLMNAIESTSGFGGSDGSRFGRGSVMSMEEAERAMHAARKEHDVLEKKLAAIMKKNKKMFGGTGKA
jgi:CCR4-NOT transcription complex subunit 4